MERKRLLSLVGGIVLSVAVASATPITFEGSSGNLSAAVTFDIVAAQLVVTLTNTSPHDVLIPSGVLTAVFFDIAGNPVLTRVSAVLKAGSVVWWGGTDPGGVVGGEWAYRNGLSGAPGNARYGISSVGFGLFAAGHRFPGNNLQGPDAPGGIDYGITSAGDNPATGNAPVTGGNALIKNSVVFTLGLPAGFGPELPVSNVWFQYGSSLEQPSFEGLVVPEPGAWALLGTGIALLFGLRGRIARRGRS